MLGEHRQDYLAVRLCSEAKALSLEALPELPEVVELAVVSQPIPSVRIGHWLGAAFGDIDDAQPTVAKGSRLRTVNTGEAADSFSVRAAMRHQPGHGGDQTLVRDADRSTYPAHTLSPAAAQFAAGSPSRAAVQRLGLGTPSSLRRAAAGPRAVSARSIGYRPRKTS